MEIKEACVLVCTAGSKKVLAYSPMIIVWCRGMHTADFIVTPYFNVQGRFDAALPAHCPSHVDDGTVCTIRAHSWRLRKTGPMFALRVAKCKTHGKCFTLYPPGFSPYARKPVIRCAPDGTDILLDEPAKPLTEFEHTLFHAALDADRGVAWARNSRRAIPTHWWSTQLRHLDEVTRFLGLTRDLVDRVRDLIAATLRVPGLLLREHDAAHGYRAIGNAVRAVLMQLDGNASSRALRLLHCRHLAADRPCPRVWDPKRKHFECVPFRHAGTAAPT
jgi:hypothetical protein